MKIKSPWKTLNTKIVYSNPWITVREDQVVTPTGAPGIYGVVETKIATGVLALTDDDQLYLVGQYRYPLDLYSWELIEGGAERGEAPLRAIQRELREEAGLEATDWQQLGGVLHLSNCYSNEEAYLFVARGLTEVPSGPDETELLKVKKVPFTEAVDLVKRGEITDALSVIGILLYESRRQSGLPG